MKPFFLIVGPSGSGKTTLTYQLETVAGLTALSSYTTRPPRWDGEKGHIFVDDYREWMATHSEGELVGYTHYNGYDYWATEAQVDQHDLYVLDPAGVEFFKKHYHGDRQVKVVYINSNVRERYRRMRARGDSAKDTIRRIIYDWKAFAGRRKKADFVVRNDILQSAFRRLYGYIQQVQEG